MASMRRRSRADTATSWLSDRSRRELLATLRRPAICRPRRSLPLPVIPIRFAVPWCVLALPMVPSPCLLLRCHDHDHVAAFEQRRGRRPPPPPPPPAGGRATGGARPRGG